MVERSGRWCHTIAAHVAGTRELYPGCGNLLSYGIVKRAGAKFRHKNRRRLHVFVGLKFGSTCVNSTVREWCSGRKMKQIADQ